MLQIPRFRQLSYIMLAALSALLVIVVTACSNQETNRADSVLIVATSPDFPPFEFTTATGELQGFDIDLITAIAESQNITLEFEPMSYGDVIRSLSANAVDAAISAITITPDRVEVVSFSRPYFEGGLAIAVADANTDITDAAMLQGKRIGVQARTTGETFAQGVANARVQRFETIDEAFSQLAAGKLDAVINDAPVTQYSLRQGLLTNIKAIEPLLTQEYYGIAVPKDSKSLEVINAGLTTIMENGQYAEIYSKWFDQAPPSLPESVPGV
ncbi:MAG: basic amino acid ABC transporter substrate-binding protein [Synechococcales cyanobacterium T60_A2020_003]|nr:basic amino acid ABC transporter substrate-binding protein [Synechococcales cyanobacterium T60_A2020_003]